MVAPPLSRSLSQAMVKTASLALSGMTSPKSIFVAVMEMRAALVKLNLIPPPPGLAFANGAKSNDAKAAAAMICVVDFILSLFLVALLRWFVRS